MFLTEFTCDWKDKPDSESRNPLKSGQCFLLDGYDLCEECYAVWVAIPSNRVNVSYFYEWELDVELPYEPDVAIPSNRVNVSYKNDIKEGGEKK